MSKRKGRWESAYLNNMTFIDYYDRLKEIAINRYKWINLPDGCDSRYMELELFERGEVVYFKDDVLDMELCLPVVPTAPFDVNNNPIKSMAFANNGYNYNVDESNSVIIYDNFLRRSIRSTIELYARRLYELERTLDVNIKAQKTPIMIQSTEQQRLTMENLYMQYDGNKPFIFTNKDIDIEAIKVLNTNSPFVADKIEELKSNIWFEALQFLGVITPPDYKRERLTTDEVKTTNNIINIQGQIGLNSRQKAVEKINRMFNRHITVEFNFGIEQTYNTQYGMRGEYNE